MTVSDLIDYLQQFDGNETVVLTDDDYKGTGEYITLGGLDYSHEEADTEAEPTEPEEGDITTGDHRRFYQDHKLVVEVGEDEDWRKAVKEYMDKDQFWPNVWLISDHGNAHLMSLEDEE